MSSPLALRCHPAYEINIRPSPKREECDVSSGSQNSNTPQATRARRTTAKASGRGTTRKTAARRTSASGARKTTARRSTSSSNSHGTTLDAIEKQIKKLPANLRRGSASWLKSARKLAKDAEKAVSGGGRSAAKPARKATTRKATTRKAPRASRPRARPRRARPRRARPRRARPRRGSRPRGRPRRAGRDTARRSGTAARVPRHAAPRHAARRRAARPPRALGSTALALGHASPRRPHSAGGAACCVPLDARRAATYNLGT